MSPRGRTLAAASCALLLSACAGSRAVVPAAPASQPGPVAGPAAISNPIKQPPTLGPVKPLTIPTVVERRLSNGLRVVVVEHHELPVLDLFVVVRTGAEADPAGKAGLATLTTNLLDEGAAGRSSLAIAEQTSFLGISLATGAAWEQSRISLHTPVAQIDSALALLADVTLRPSFPENELERLRRERLTALLQQKDRAPAIADAVFSSVVFGTDHPYGHALVGDEATVPTLSAADIRSFYETYYRPNNTTVIVVGDVRPDDIVMRLERLFGAWRPGTVPATSYPNATAATGTTVYLIDKPGAAQSSVRIGGLAAARTTPDYFPLQVMNMVLGGAFTSRLSQNLREDKGYTYGAYSGFDMRKATGLFDASAEIVSEKTDSALIEALEEIRGIHQPIPAPELEKAKSYLQLGLPSEFETTFGIAARLVPLALFDLPLDYFNSFSRNVMAVTQADAERVAKRYISPAALHIVVVGDLKVIEPGIRALGLGTVVRRDLSGRAILP